MSKPAGRGPPPQPSDKRGSHLRRRILKEPVVGVKHFPGEQEEPFSGNPSVVQAFLPLKLYPQPGLQALCLLHRDNSAVGVLKDVVPVKLQFKLIGNISLKKNRGLWGRCWSGSAWMQRRLQANPWGDQARWKEQPKLWGRTGQRDRAARGPGQDLGGLGSPFPCLSAQSDSLQSWPSLPTAAPTRSVTFPVAGPFCPLCVEGRAASCSELWGEHGGGELGFGAFGQTPQGNSSGGGEGERLPSPRGQNWPLSSSGGGGSGGGFLSFCGGRGGELLTKAS